MPRTEDLIAGVATWSVNAKATNGVATATKAASATLRHTITGFSISASAAPLAAVEATIAEGATNREVIEIPAAAFAPIFVNRKLSLAENQKAEGVLPALGAAVVGSITIHGFSTPA